MTDTLAAMILSMTCPDCHGEGKRVSSQVLKNVFGQHVRQTATGECESCVGTGVSREWKQS